jgi:hypothetical protein
MVLNADAGANFAASWTVLLPTGLRRFGGRIHTTGFDVGWPLQALQPGNLGPLLDNQLLERGNLGQQHDHQFPQLGRHQAIEVFCTVHT